MDHLRPLAALFLALSPASAAAQVSLRAEVLATGVDYPTQVVGSPLDPDVLFVVQQDGQVLELANGVMDPVPFIDLSSKVLLSPMGGMANMLFHPEYANNGWVYFGYSSSVTAATVVRYTVPNPTSYVVDLSSELEILTVTDVISFHAGGGMDFSNDGKLLVAFGDRRAELVGGGCTAQDGGVLIGKVLRLNSDGTIPADNPYVGVPGVMDEIFAWGLRQPVRLSVDPPTGDVWITEVGEAQREEVVRIPGTSTGGENFGWRVMEGSLCTNTTECNLPCPNPQFEPAVFEVDHSVACAFLGGHVYRGSKIPALVGRYVFADWCYARIWSFELQGGVATDLQEHTAQLEFDASFPLSKITSIGRGSDGELYLVDSGSNGGIPGLGRIARIEPWTPLVADVTSVSVSLGGTQTLELTGPALEASKLYVLLGSVTGSSPGTPAGAGWVLPLNWDAYLSYTLANVNTPPLGGSFGFLDPAAKASASFSLPPGGAGTLVGLKLYHAYVVFEPTFDVAFTSNAVEVDLIL